jgi:hypothetical protein
MKREFLLRRSDLRFRAGGFFLKPPDFGHFLARGRSCAMKLRSLFAPNYGRQIQIPFIRRKA